MLDKDTLAYKLLEYSRKNLYPFHMPGHKKNLPEKIKKLLNSYENIDVTELEETDDLHLAKGIIKDSLIYASKVYNTKKTYFMVNGSSAGVHIALRTCNKADKKIIFAENSHISAFNSIELNNIKSIFIKVEKEKKFGFYLGLRKEDVEDIFVKNDDIAAVFMTSPTYEGIISDVKSIADICHKNGAILIVDEAHGAHLQFMKKENSAINMGADIVIQSLHKTMPSFTQTALLHVNSDRVSIEEIENNIKIFETSSPSYIFMSSIDLAIRYTNEEAGEKIYDYLTKLKNFRKNKFINFEIYNPNDNEKKMYRIKDFDETKILILIKNNDINTKFLIKRLKEKKIQFEMYEKKYILAISTYLDKEEGFVKLNKALKEVDKEIEEKFFKEYSKEKKDISINKKRKILIKNQNKVYQNNIYIYPPGIPILKKGDILDKKKLKEILFYLDKGYKIFL